MRRSPDLLDGLPTRPELPPGLQEPPGLERGLPVIRERSRSPLREAAHGAFSPGAEAFQWLLGKALQQEEARLGAHSEFHYKNETAEVQAKIDKSRLKEWNNWKQFGAVRIIKPTEVESFRQQHPEMEILPTRWVDTNKAEVGQEPIHKSRLVARGDLEKDTSLRTDSPTTSQLFLHVIISFAATESTPLKAGDISAAFLQGQGITRMLAMWLPSDGIPDSEVEPGSMMVAMKSVYGTRDAPRSFWKGLHSHLLESGLKIIPGETSAYYLPGPEGKINGLLGTHVDDLLWTGGEAMDEVMKKVQEIYKFGLVEGKQLKYCGRIIQQTEEGIKVTSPNVLDRVKPIFIEQTRRSK